MAGQDVDGACSGGEDEPGGHLVRRPESESPGRQPPVHPVEEWHEADDEKRVGRHETLGRDAPVRLAADRDRAGEPDVEIVAREVDPGGGLLIEHDPEEHDQNKEASQPADDGPLVDRLGRVRGPVLSHILVGVVSPPDGENHQRHGHQCGREEESSQVPGLGRLKRGRLARLGVDLCEVVPQDRADLVRQERPDVDRHVEVAECPGAELVLPRPLLIVGHPHQGGDVRLDHTAAKRQDHERDIHQSQVRLPDQQLADDVGDGEQHDRPVLAEEPVGDEAAEEPGGVAPGHVQVDDLARLGPGFGEHVDQVERQDARIP